MANLSKHHLLQPSFVLTCHCFSQIKIYRLEFKTENNCENTPFMKQKIPRASAVIFSDSQTNIDIYIYIYRYRYRYRYIDIDIDIDIDIYVYNRYIDI